MTELQRTTPEAGQASGGAFEKVQSDYSTSAAVFPYYNTHEATEPAKYISLDDLAEQVTFGQPAIGPKNSAPLITPFKANGKTKDHAIKAKFYALVDDHDDDDKSREEIRATYDPFGMAYFAFTSSNHQQDKKGVIASRWKVVIPFASPLAFDEYAELARGAALHLVSDKAQSRITQGFYAPNKLTESAPFDCIDATDRSLLDPNDITHPFVSACLAAYKREQEAQQAKAKEAAPKPRPALTGSQAGIIDKVNAQHELADELRERGYTQKGKKHLSPHSSTGVAGGIILTGDDGKERFYSHHGETDPLSSLNHDGHALDVFDVLCVLDHGGDVSKAVAHYAPRVDAEGQKQRQRDHMAAKDTLSRFTPEQVERLTMEAETEHTGPEFDLPPLPHELYALPDGLGAIQDYIHGAMTYPCRYTAGWAALATLTGFAQTNVTIDSRRGLGFNEYYLTLAKTGFGKEELRDPLNTLISELDFDSNVSDSNLPAVEQAAPSSKQGLHSVLEAADNHSVYVQSDEFAEWLKAASNDSHKQQALAYLLEIYNRALRKIHPGHAVTNKYEAVKNPRLSVFATTTAESVLRSLNLNDAEMGAYNRWVIYVAPETMPEKRYTGMNFTPSLEAVSAVAFIASMTPTKIAFTACGLKEYIAQDKEHAEPIKFKDGLMGGRLSEQAIKLAGLIALSAKRTEINSDDVELAYKIRMGLYYRTAALVEQSGAISGSHETTKALEQVRNALKPGTPIYVSQLKSRSRAYNALHLNEQNAVIRTLIEHGDAEFIDDRRKVLVWRK